jgi:hypothetical protein
MGPAIVGELVGAVSRAQGLKGLHLAGVTQAQSLAELGRRKGTAGLGVQERLPTVAAGHSGAEGSGLRGWRSASRIG